ncbi:hypothetical protein A3K86_03290 [Photobacterium jeanii]|uniref:Uncharacterized protein n=1 Tax=Photobacterium jeanii TaxID=858640 RepID=A0A178KLF2_9GAMM|nr:hypothetical protein A3K86_03290 [Photobacterium jeanii]PST92374.1 spore gernimation protein [Photobacterium jeanii]
MSLKYKVAALIVTAAFTLTACNDGQLSVSPVRDVQNIEVQNDHTVRVECETGICQFELTTANHDEIKVNMFYNSKLPFEKIEGVSVTGPEGATVRIEGNNQFTLELEGSDKPTKVQVIDYYRN